MRHEARSALKAACSVLLNRPRPLPAIGSYTVLSPRAARMLAGGVLALLGAAIPIAIIGKLAQRPAPASANGARPAPVSKIVARCCDANGNPVEPAPWP